MPCSQITSINCNPPRAIDDANTAKMPAAKPRMRSNCRSSIGSAARRSIGTKATSSAIPPNNVSSVAGFVQPIARPPYG